MSQKVDKLKVPETSSWYIRIFPTYERGSVELRVWWQSRTFLKRGRVENPFMKWGRRGAKIGGVGRWVVAIA